MQLVILSGGKGTRLHPLTEKIPKTMVSIYNKPVLEYHLELAKAFGIKEVVMCIGHLPKPIMGYFGDGSKHGVNLHYSLEDVPLGTGGPLSLAKNLIKEDFFLLNGDILCQMDLKKLESFHKKNNALATIVVHVSSHPEDSDLIEHKEGKVTKIWTKPHSSPNLPSNLTIAGAYFCNRKIIDFIPLTQISFEREVLPRLLKEGENICAYDTNEYLRDMGTFERLEEIEQTLHKNKGVLPLFLK